jgi:hypothetical protein
VLKKILKFFGSIVILIVVATITLLINAPSKEEKEQKDANEAINSRLDQLRDTCESRIKLAVVNKSTLDISSFGSQRWKGDNGNYYATMDFSAKNKFGLLQNFKATCIEDAAGKISFQFSERIGK